MFRHEQMNPGDPITARLMNALAAEVARLGRISATPPLYLRDDIGGPNLGIDLSLMRLAMTGAGGIPARAGTTLGSGPITLQLLKIAGTTVSLVAERADTAYNWAGTAVGASRYILVFPMAGVLIVLSEDCP
jgi:hypothetical protein